MEVIWLSRLVEKQNQPRFYDPVIEGAQNSPQVGSFPIAWTTMPASDPNAFAVGTADVTAAQKAVLDVTGNTVVIDAADRFTVTISQLGQGDKNKLAAFLTDVGLAVNNGDTLEAAFTGLIRTFDPVTTIQNIIDQMYANYFIASRANGKH